jgi:hypothetical protein
MGDATGAAELAAHGAICTHIWLFYCAHRPPVSGSVWVGGKVAGGVVEYCVRGWTMR